MPRYRFSWLNLPAELLEEFRELLEIDESEQVAEFLAETYGARPQEDFIEDTFELLREVWLVNDAESRVEIASTLRERELGDVSIVDDLEYLRSCRNTSNLRRIVLPVFITIGEQTPRAKSLLEGSASGDNALPKKSARQASEDSENTKSASPTDGLPKKASRGGLGVDKGVEVDSEDKEQKSPVENVGNPVDHFRSWLLDSTRKITEIESLEPDEDGDIPVDFGSSRTYLSPRPNPLSVDIYSVLLSEINSSLELFEAINKANCETLFAKLKYLPEQKQIILHHELDAKALSSESLERHIVLIGRMADSLDSELKREFGGVMHSVDSREDEQDV